MTIYPPPEMPTAEQHARSQEDRDSRPGTSWPFWAALAVGGGVGIWTRDWTAVVLSAVATYLTLAIPYMVLARRFGWRPLRPFDLVFDLVNFISG